MIGSSDCLVLKKIRARGRTMPYLCDLKALPKVPTVSLDMSDHMSLHVSDMSTYPNYQDFIFNTHLSGGEIRIQDMLDLIRSI